MRRALWAAAAALAGVACHAGPALEGSLSEALDLSYDSVELRRSPTALQISYLRSGGREVVARLTVASEGIGVSGTIALQGEYAPGHPRTRVTRAVDGEPLRVLPPVAQGELEITRGRFEPGARASGRFSLSFGEGGDIGTGRTLRGDFDGTVLEAR